MELESSDTTKPFEERLLLVSKKERVRKLIEFLSQRADEKLAVFVESQREAEVLHQELRSKSLRITFVNENRKEPIEASLANPG